MQAAAAASAGQPPTHLGSWYCHVGPVPRALHMQAARVMSYGIMHTAVLCCTTKVPALPDQPHRGCVPLDGCIGSSHDNRSTVTEREGGWMVAWS